MSSAKNRAAGYTRVSTSGQAFEGESLELQNSRIKQYCQTQGWKLIKIYEDAGISGGHTNRPAFQQMLHDAEENKFDILIVYKIDRLSRSILDFYQTMQILQKHEISFVSITQNFDTSTSMGRLMLAILVDFANFEREINIDRAKDSYLKRLSDGYHSGRIPYGYKRIKGNIFKIIPEEAENVKTIFNLALQGLSFNQIAEKIGFNKDKIRSILTNPIYTGYICPRSDKHGHRLIDPSKWYKGRQETIISLDVFQKVINSKLKPNAKKYIALFSRLIWCSKCKHNLSHKFRHGYHFYQCDKLKGVGCFKTISEQFLEDHFIQDVDILFKTGPVILEDNDTEEQFKKIEQKIKRAIALLDTNIPIPEIRKKIEELNRQKLMILSQKEKPKPNYQAIANALQDFKSLYPHMTREEKRRLWSLVIERIFLKERKITVLWKNGRYTKYDKVKFYRKHDTLCGGDEGRSPIQKVWKVLKIISENI